MKTKNLPLLLLLFSSNLWAMDIVAHRGASHLAPENTLAAVRLAWELGADAVEVDVHLTKDNRVVVIHDDTTLRTTGQDHIVAATPLAVLRTLDAGSFKDPSYAGEKIPLISEVLATVPEGKKLLIEIKCRAEVLLPLSRAISTSKKEKNVIIMSFDYQVAWKAKQFLPGIPVFWLKSAEKDRETGQRLPHGRGLIAKAQVKNLDGLGLDYRGVTPEIARRVLERELKLYVWTVDQVNEALRLEDLGIHGLITNRPAWMRKQIMAH